jgi:surface carbohydrate biosynthesis protein
MGNIASSCAPLIIPVEIAARELDAKLLLACLSAGSGRPTILGCRFDLDLRADQLPRGVRLEKGMTDASYKMFRNLRDLGYALAAWDEEALVYYSDHAYAETRLSRRSAALLQMMMAWGEDNRRLWARAAQYPGVPIVVTGNARADLLRPEFHKLHSDDAAAIRSAYGDFILINSNFGSVNFYHPGRETKFDRYVTAHRAEGLREHRIALFQAFLKLVPIVARAFPERKIVVRPHPAEDHRPWFAIAAAWPNVKVVHGGSVLPWLAAAAAMIHNGCTTAIESYLLGRPAIAYRPVISEAHDIHLPNGVSHNAFDAESLIGLLAARLDGSLDDRAILQQGDAILSQFITARDGPLAAERILDAVRHLTPPQMSGLGVQARRLHRFLRMRYRRHRKLAALGTKKGRDAAAFRQRNFPNLSAIDLGHRADALRSAWPNLPIVAISQIYPNVYEIVASEGGSHG